MAIARLILTVQPQSYSGKDLEDLYPNDFIDKYTTTVGFKWRQSDMGPESWSLTIAAGYTLGKLVSGFIGELSKDLYTWSKEKILEKIRETSYPNDGLLLFIEELPNLLNEIDPSLCEDWSIIIEEDQFKLEPNLDSLRQRLTTNTARDVDDLDVAEALARWEANRKSCG